MHALLEQIFSRQVRSLIWIYSVIASLLLGLCAVCIIIGSPSAWLLSPYLPWTEAGLSLLAVLLLGVAVPLARRRLLDPGHVRRAGPETLVAWGLPAGVDPILGRQAVFLTRYTAGCVISWGLAASVGLYGLVVRMLGASAPVTGGFLAAAVFAYALLPPLTTDLRKALADFD